MKLVSNISIVQHPTGRGENLSLIGHMETVRVLSTRQYRGDNLGFLWSRQLVTFLQGYRGEVTVFLLFVLPVIQGRYPRSYFSFYCGQGGLRENV